MTLEERWQAQLEGLRRQGRYRQLAAPRGIDFSSNDYLGYGKLLWKSVEEFSRSGQASRLLRGHHPIWEEVEARLAAWHGAEAALMMTSGYVANEGLLSTVIEPGDWVASDECNHASIVDGLRLARAEKFVYRHDDWQQLIAGLAAPTEETQQRQRFIVTESLFGMEGTAPQMVRPVLLAKDFKAHLIVDEAHATGCFGAGGSGLIDECNMRKFVLATVHTGGKALGVPGAYVCCSRLLKNLLVNRCRHLIFTTALPPAVGQWWLETLDRVQEDEASRDALRHNAELFREALRRHGIEARGGHYIVPIIVGEDNAAVRAADELQKQGFDVRAIRPPTVPAGTARLRISIHADHERASLAALAEALGRVLPVSAKRG